MEPRYQAAVTPVHYPLTGQYQQSSVASHYVNPNPSQQISAATPSYQASAAGFNYGGATTTSYASGSAIRGTPAGPERVQSTRKISSTIVNEQIMGPPPQDYPVREVEVPGETKEVVTYVEKKVPQVYETKVAVPKIVYVDKFVDRPVPEIVTKYVEVPQYVDVPVPKKVTQYVDVPKEVIVEKKVPKINYVEQVVEVPGEVVYQPVPYNVDQIVEITQYTDHKKPVIVAQAVRPVFVEGAGVTEVDVYEYEPECVPVDVHVVKGVQAQVQVGGVVETTHKVVSVPAAQYNTVLEQLNVRLDKAERQKLPYLTDRGQVTFLGEYFYTADVPAGAMVSGLDMSNLVTTNVDYASRRVLPVNDPRVAGSGMAAGMTGGMTTTQKTTEITTTGPVVGSSYNIVGNSGQMGGMTTSAGGYGASVGMSTGGYGSSVGYSTGGAMMQQGATMGGATSMNYSSGSYGATTNEYVTKTQTQQQSSSGYGNSGTLLVPSNTFNKGSPGVPALKPTYVTS